MDGFDSSECSGEGKNGEVSWIHFAAEYSNLFRELKPC
jgi:hypothetical protein